MVQFTTSASIGLLALLAASSAALPTPPQDNIDARELSEKPVLEARMEARSPPKQMGKLVADGAPRSVILAPLKKNHLQQETERNKTPKKALAKVHPSAVIVDIVLVTRYMDSDMSKRDFDGDLEARDLDKDLEVRGYWDLELDELDIRLSCRGSFNVAGFTRW
ncbi:hypothetical protein AMATHDRAFT_50571 [Amanita thiersii Skay4041]|uniref:Uncharacterized protein n=1 Tax=Amanita thiersii Skay4041 TaxID=703135 RepID=A0A2A9NAG4_9AGAR|nr:hypothetical protein AMATHDRAFT_50571 [Amanita thiersii Skay4041]